MGEVHQLLLEFGKEAALKATGERAVVEAAAGYLAAEDAEIGFIYSGWAQAALPHRRLADDAVWSIKTERLGLLVQPGLRMVPDGPEVPIGVPYGSRPASSYFTYNPRRCAPDPAESNLADHCGCGSAV